MARPIRLEFAGALYHVTSRGDRREAIYEDDADRERFLAVLADVVSNDIQFHALRRHPDLRTSGLAGGSVMGGCECCFEISESVASPFDIENVSLVQKTVKNGRCEGFIAGE